MAKGFTGRTEIEKEFVKAYDKLCYRQNPWTVWQDFVNLFACSIANAVDRDKKRWDAREKSYMDTIHGYTEEEVKLFTELSGLTIMALEENPAQDFLGDLYMRLDFGSGWHGQFFTPRHVSEAMAKMLIGSGLYEQLERQGYISVNDPACGAGCMLLAFARACMEDPKIGNYQPRVLFVAQDVDKAVAQMCYIQLSLLGCAGYVIVGNTLTQPPTGDVLSPSVPDGCELWLTPMYFSDVWTGRLAVRLLASLFEKPTRSEDQQEEANADPQTSLW